MRSINVKSEKQCKFDTLFLYLLHAAELYVQTKPDVIICSFLWVDLK